MVATDGGGRQSMPIALNITGNIKVSTDCPADLATRLQL